MNKLTDWLKTWHANRARTDKAPFKGIGNVRCIAITCYSWNSATASDNGWEKKAALRRLGQPIDIARGALLLASDEADFITGHELVVDGGLTLRT